ncbi:MAG: glycosyltransferase family 4 protein [Terracidiphilus sp.]
MLANETASSGEETYRHHRRPHILMGVTCAQTCLVLPGRLRALRDAGFKVSLLSAPGELLHQTARTEHADAFAVPMERGISPVRDVIALVRIWRLLRHIKPDIVEFSTPKAGLLGVLAARFCGIPVRIYLLRGLKLETSRGLRRLLLFWAERVASGSADLVVCNSQSLRKQVLAMGIAPASKLVLLGGGSSGGVNLARFAAGPSIIRKQFEIPHDAPLIGFSGRLTVDKGLPELLEAFAVILRHMPDAYLLLVGWFDASEDALDSGVRARIEGHPRIICTGFVEDTAPYYRAMDLLVLPSWREGFPNAVLEAAATGVPVIATHCTGSCDAVIPEVTGLLVPTGSPDAICEAVLSLLSDPARRQRMAAAARTWVAENYEDRRVLGLAVALYMSLIAPTQDLGSRLGERQPEVVSGLPASL